MGPWKSQRGVCSSSWQDGGWGVGGKGELAQGPECPTGAGLLSQSLWHHRRLTREQWVREGGVARCEQGGQEAGKEAVCPSVLPDFSRRLHPRPLPGYSQPQCSVEQSPRNVASVGPPTRPHLATAALEAKPSRAETQVEGRAVGPEGVCFILSARPRQAQRGHVTQPGAIRKAS